MSTSVVQLAYRGTDVARSRLTCRTESCIADTLSVTNKETPMASKGPTPKFAPPAATMPWWKEPTRDQWKTLIATWGGWCLDIFDYFLLVLVLTEVSKTFGVTLVAMGTVITGTLICRLFGGVIFGTWGDRVGRKLPLMVSILAFSVFSALSGLAPNFKWFFLCRLLFGFGMGGE